MGVYPRLEFDYIRFINCMGYDFFLFMVHLSFYAIPLLRTPSDKAYIFLS